MAGALNASHSHSADAWTWANHPPRETNLIFCRYTQIGLLRLLTNQVVLGEQTLTLRKAWSVYDRWLADPRVEFYPEPRGVDAEFREATGRLPPRRHRNGSAIVGCSHWQTASGRLLLPSIGRCISMPASRVISL
jgi:predicted nucleic acid-binding protein